MYALFVALAMAVSFIEIPLMPAAPWLKYDPSGIVCILAGFAFGPSGAVIVSVLGFVPHLFVNPLGAVMAILVALDIRCRSPSSTASAPHAQVRSPAFSSAPLLHSWRPSWAICSSPRSTRI